MVTVMHVAVERTFASLLGTIVQQQHAVLSRKSLSGSQVPLRELMPALSHFQFWILFNTRFDDIDVICPLGGSYSKKL